MTVTVGQMARELKFENLTPHIDLDQRALHARDVNHPAIQMTGFFESFDCDRVQIVGNIEKCYMATLDPELRRKRFEELLKRDVPCFVYCRGNMPQEDLLELANQYNTIVLATKLVTSEASARVLHFIQRWLTPTMTVHGVLMDVLGEGVLITGESGIGKSELALALIKRGHRLVSDDAVELRRVNEDTLIGTAPMVTKDFLEIRGVGIVDVKSLFGVQSVKNEMPIDLVVQLEDWSKEAIYDRLGDNTDETEYLGNKVALYHLPIRPGRNVAVILEAIAINFRQKEMGYNAVDELYRRIQKNMEAGSDEDI